MTDFSGSYVVTFANNATNTLGTFGSGYATPEDVHFDTAGNVYVGNLSGPGVLKFNSAGVSQGTFAAGGQRVDWFDFNAGLTKMYYTDETGVIHTWHIVTNTAGADLGSNLGDFALRLLGDGTLLVAAEGDGVNRVDATTGAIIHNYSAASLGTGSAWFSLNLDPDGTSFWTGSFDNGRLDKVNIATGALEQSYTVAGGANSLFGVSVYGEITQATTPEPGTIVLLCSGLAGIFLAKRRMA